MGPKGNSNGSKSEVLANKIKGRLVTRRWLVGVNVNEKDFSWGKEATVSEESADGNTASFSWVISGPELEYESKTVARSPPSRNPAKKFENKIYIQISNDTPSERWTMDHDTSIVWPLKCTGWYDRHDRKEDVLDLRVRKAPHRTFCIFVRGHDHKSSTARSVINGG